MKNAPAAKCCGCPCHRMNGFMLTLIGLTFLLGTLDVLSQKIVGIVWPVLLMLIGLKSSFGRGMCSCCNEE